jgi:hypothetical protein
LCAGMYNARPDFPINFVVNDRAAFLLITRMLGDDLSDRIVAAIMVVAFCGLMLIFWSK